MLEGDKRLGKDGETHMSLQRGENCTAEHSPLSETEDRMAVSCQDLLVEPVSLLGRRVY